MAKLQVGQSSRSPRCWAPCPFPTRSTPSWDYTSSQRVNRLGRTEVKNFVVFFENDTVTRWEAITSRATTRPWPSRPCASSAATCPRTRRRRAVKRPAPSAGTGCRDQPPSARRRRLSWDRPAAGATARRGRHPAAPAADAPGRRARQRRTIGTAFQRRSGNGVGHGGTLLQFQSARQHLLRQASTTSTSITAQSSSATRTKSLTIRSARP